MLISAVIYKMFHFVQGLEILYVIEFRNMFRFAEILLLCSINVVGIRKITWL
jgi:hypothetical protein